MKTGIHFRPCDIGQAERHNRRDKAYIDAVNASPNKLYDLFADKTATNVHWRINWNDGRYKGLSLAQIRHQCSELVKEKTGRLMQAKCTPIREGVVPCKADTQMTDFKPVIQWLLARGVSVIRIDIHHDEGHTDLQSGQRKYNHHAHIICDWIDHETGKTAKLGRLDMAQLQTVVADALHMERGEPSKKRHVRSLEYRAQKAHEEAVLWEEVRYTLREASEAQEKAVTNEITALQERLAVLQEAKDQAKAVKKKINDAKKPQL